MVVGSRMSLTRRIVWTGTSYARDREYNVMPGCRLTRTPVADPSPPAGPEECGGEETSSQSSEQPSGSTRGRGARGRSRRTAGAAAPSLEGCSHSATGGGATEVATRDAA